MKIIDILKQRSENHKDDVKIELKLYNLADDLEKKSRNHLKRITTVLAEFDIHDEKHSEKVIENIEKLLGEEKLQNLSTYELFLLHLSAFFHDCAMAPSDWEINTMKLTEGNETYFQNNFSIKHDLKTPLQFSAAQKTITENKANLYIKYDSDVKEWMFTPRNEDELIKYLSTLLIEYQNYRNGFADKLKTVKSQAEFNDLSEFIRIDYIRATHHTRVETYIKNLETLFGKAFPQPAWGKRLAHDLSLICRSHGEDSSFINDFSTNSQYYGAEDTNLQFVAIMLRLGDIIHFSYDRAPIDLRSSKLFKSEYSFQQWAIKNSGVNYSIDKGKISYRAYCESPETYFKLHQYIDWIEIEIQSYFRFQRQWPITYIDNLQDKVERVNVSNDEEVFLPKRGLKFTLNQNKILDLLMGVGLYKDKYACLRELYQNSLDAVRCMLSKSEANNNSAKGLIEFKIIKDGEKAYLACIDNGIGMTKDTIENYLLKIGNSYYKSTDFFKQQSNWGGKFTPTSQFGIGILSCFMIGTKLEITTKTFNEDYISCAVEGLHESFYYKKPSLNDLEYIAASGTIIKVLLNDETAVELNNKKLAKLGLLLLNLIHEDDIPEKFRSYLSLNENWENHLFNLLNDFVQIVPQNIILRIGIEDDTTLIIPSKPLIVDYKNQYWGIEEDDLDFLNNNGRAIHNNYIKIKNLIEIHEINIQHENTEFAGLLTFPKKGYVNTSLRLSNIFPPFNNTGLCIDGICIENDNSEDHIVYLLGLSQIGILNFTGEIRPQISVDRTSIVAYIKECSQIIKEITKKLTFMIIKVAKQHIIKNDLNKDSKEYNMVWEYVFETIKFADTLFLNDFSNTDYASIYWKKLNDNLHENKSIYEFLNSTIIIIKHLNLYLADRLTQKLILIKILSANRIKIEDLSIIIECNDLISPIDNLFDTPYFICTDQWEIFDQDFDFVSNLYPFIPKRVFDLLRGSQTKNINSRIKKTEHYFLSGIMKLFSQSTLSIHEWLDNYFMQKGLFGREKESIYGLVRRENSFGTSGQSINLFDTSNPKEKYVLMIFVSPLTLTLEQNIELEKYKNTNSLYIKGVREGWSILITSMDIDNLIIAPGKVTREHLVSLISDDFWEQYKDYTFKFTDNTIMQKSN